MKALPGSILVLLLLAGTACTGTRSGVRGSNPDRISRAEIEASSAQDAYELVQRLRPRWLQTRGSRSLTMSTGILVFLNDSRLGGLESLRQISKNGILSIRYLDAAQAIAELPGIGSEHAEAAIVVSTQSR